MVSHFFGEQNNLVDEEQLAETATTTALNNNSNRPAYISAELVVRHIGIIKRTKHIVG